MRGKGSSRNGALDCRRVVTLLGAFLEDGLSPQQEAAVRTHLQHCSDCRRQADQEAILTSQLRLEAAGQHRKLSPQAATRIQARVYRHMRRSMMTQRVGRAAWAVAALSVLLLVSLVGYAYWQQGGIGGEATPSSPIPTDGVPTPLPAATPDQPRMPDVGPAGVTYISFACAENDVQKYEPLIEAFHAQNPAIAVRLVPTEAVLAAEEEALRSLASSVDSFSLKRWLYAEEMNSGLLRDLQPFVERDPDFDPEDFYPGFLDALRWKGGLWGLPSPGTPPLLFYDRAAFRAAGLSYPEPGWTLEGFELVAHALTRRQGAEVARYGVVISPRGLAGPILVVGRALDGEVAPRPPTDAVLSSPQMVDAVEWFARLAGEVGVMPNPYTLEEGERPLIPWAVAEGHAAMWDGWPQTFFLQSYGGQYDLGVVSWPEGTPLSEWLAGGTYAMSGGTAHPDAVWQWLRFLSYLPGNPVESVPPARRSVAEGTGFWTALPADLAPALQYVVERPKVALAPGTVEALRGVLRAVVAEGQDAGQMLNQAQGESASALSASPGEAPAPVPTAQPVPTAMPLEAAITYCPMPYPYQHYYELASAFEQRHPEIDVSIARDKVSIEAFGQNCDCFSYPLWQGMFSGKSELVRNLQPLADANGGLPDDFYPGVLDAGRWQGDLWAVPAHIDFYVVRYNKDLFDAAGIAYPEPGWTTDEFWQKAKALDSGEGEVRIYGYVPGSLSGQPDDLAYFVEQRGGFGQRDKVEEITGLPPLEGTATTAAVDWYADLVAEDGGVPRYWDMDWAQRMDLIAAGRVAMWTEYVDTDFPVRFGRGTAPLPLDGGVVRHWRVVGHMISAGSDEPDACWTWIQFLLDQPAVAGEQAPVRHGFADTPEYIAGPEADVLAANRFSLGHMDGVARRSHYSLYLALEAILDGEPVGLVVEQVVAADEALRDCLDGVSGSILEEHVAACREELDTFSTGE